VVLGAPVERSHQLKQPFIAARDENVVPVGEHAAHDALNLLGRYNDDRSDVASTKTRHVALEHRNFGEFKVPSLRNVALTAPYMHNGSLATLADVVRHYSELDLDRLHADGESILRPLKLAREESSDLVAFLVSLTERESAVPAKRISPACQP